MAYHAVSAVCCEPNGVAFWLSFDYNKVGDAHGNTGFVRQADAARQQAEHETDKTQQ